MPSKTEYRSQGRYAFHPALRTQIEKNVDSLNYWWESGVVAFQKIKIGPEIAKTAMTLSEEMRDYLMSYVDYRAAIHYVHHRPLAIAHHMKLN